MIKKPLNLLAIATLTALPFATLAAPAPQFDPDYFSQGMSQGHPWVSGGIGKAERETLGQHLGEDYNLKLEFAREDGHYLAEVAVTIADPQGTPVVSAASPGPWFLTELPAGEYRVIASADGRTFERQVVLPEQGSRTLVFSGWQSAP